MKVRKESPGLSEECAKEAERLHRAFLNVSLGRYFPVDNNALSIVEQAWLTIHKATLKFGCNIFQDNLLAFVLTP